MSGKMSFGRRGLCMLGAAALLGSSPAMAQSYPDKAIRVVVPFAPGGGSDALARVIGQKLSARWGQSIVVDNRPGAGGVLGTEMVAKAAPDGYTLLVTDSSAVTMNPWLYTKLPYAAKDLTPVAHLAKFSLVLLVPPNSPYNSLADLIAADNAKPGSLNAGSAGNGTSPHLVLEMLNSVAGTHFVHVPYKGGGPANMALLTGELDILFNGLSSNTAPMISSGKAKPIAVTTQSRIPSVPSVPTIAESGFPGVEAISAQSLFAPAGTPAEIVHKLHAEIAQILREPDVVELWQKSAYLPTVDETPEEISTWLATESEKWGRIVREGNIKLD